MFPSRPLTRTLTSPTLVLYIHCTMPADHAPYDKLAGHLYHCKSSGKSYTVPPNKVVFIFQL